MRKSPILVAVMGLALSLQAQQQLSPEAYNSLKASGELPESFELDASGPKEVSAKVKPEMGSAAKGGGGSDCGCYIEPDGSYTELIFDGFESDDGSFGPLTIPFQFNLYGDLWNTLFININGNISFGTSYSTFTASGFPNPDFVMVAPFWADVDLGGIGNGTLKYKVTPTALYVNWDNVGYYNEHTDKLNTFQLIITDGTDPVIGVGNNAAFCYKDMQWTTGDASSGVNGFGGSPAVVGANKGDGVDFVQFATFDHAGTDYDGPFGNPDGIDWLDYKSFVLNTAVSGSNVAPIVSGLNICDTLTMCVGEVLDLEVTFIAPEQDQITTATSSAPTLSNYVETNNTVGINAIVNGQVTAMAADQGFHTVSFSATDDGTPPLTSFIDVVIHVLPSPSAPPIITPGSMEICAGESVTLSANSGFDTYQWSTGAGTNSINVGAGTYTVTGAIGGCELVSDPVTITENPLPLPVIDGVLFACGDDPTELSTVEEYASYTWSNGATDPTIMVGSGTYSVQVVDDNGCAGGSASVVVNISPDPDANASANPPGPSLPGTLVSFTDLSTIDNGSIVTWFWDFGDGQTASTPNPSNTYIAPGTYNVTLVVATADGCSDTYSFVYIVQPEEVVVPNVFTPNSDGDNESFEILGLEGYPGSDLKVFSRWGNVVYESNNYKNNWRASDVADGTYFYILDLNRGETLTGTVNILR